MAKKFLYFATGDDANATGEAACYEVSAFRGFDPLSGTTLGMYFTMAANGDDFFECQILSESGIILRNPLSCGILSNS